MGAIVEFGSSWLLWYAAFATLFLVVGAAVSLTNKRMPAKKIQQRDCPAALVRRDILQSLRSLAVITLFLSGGLFLRERGYGWPAQELSVATVVVSFVVSLFLFDAWFYWMHRLIHHRLFYKHVHKWHHRAVTPTVWSNNSDTFLDNLFLQSYFFWASLILPIPAAVLIAHKLYDQFSGMLGHSGYEYAAGRFSAFPSPMIGVTFHDQHHEYFTYNFATHFSIWDRLMGTAHEEYDQKVTSFAGEDYPSTLEPDRSDRRA